MPDRRPRLAPSKAPGDGNLQGHGAIHTAGLLLVAGCAALMLAACGGGGGSGGTGSASAVSGDTVAGGVAGGVVSITSASSTGAAPGAAAAGIGTNPSKGADPVAITGYDALRLAEQAAFGPTPELVAQISAKGSAWIDEQIRTPATGYAAMAPVSTNGSATCPPTGSPTCFRDKYTAFPIQLRFFQNALTGPDQLRQRVALAYSQIFVVSSATLMPGYALRNYQQLLLDGAFVNFRQLLNDITLSPVMGAYLNMVNNAKAVTGAKVTPNENFARELMQLFTIGPVTLNPDGTPVLLNGQRVPAYTQATVEGFAKVFTGWTYPTAQGPTAASELNPVPWFNGTLVPVASQHDAGSKALLGGVVLPAGQSPQADLQAALDNVFNHPNVGPFLGRQLIQFLVTSNPSPAYVARITAVFNDDGTRTRGNLAAVVKAILLDPEARGNAVTDARFGKLREPVVDVAAVLRALSARSDGEYPNYVAFLMGQPLFGASTVFNYYPPNYPMPKSSTLVAPQFGILNTATASARLNFISAVVYAPGGLVFPPDSSVAGAIGTRVDLKSYEAIGAGSAAALVQRFNTDLMHGSFGTSEIDAIIAAVNAFPAGDARFASDRARSAAYVTLASPRYQVTR